nr:unnamed protein product [Digitaria exilis]
MACTHQDIVFDVNAIGWAPSGARTALSLHHEEDATTLPTAAVGHGHKPSGRVIGTRTYVR